ncbi:hypothetical protein BC939DRAFT_482197 [Gamsiella multidivaricata]|uniref:uncharacterized protein n=1 Tax=Gamsiella multidivaricata TaxID=101098 RepID=UPI0022205DE1|nr:uncharacterized protein BC939DRAFT_482197 [Gamsiella multidivaricata]KAI7816255.1 hypothetical protein BC939DRAFT_482197 [Gamsiella multidivaricata]
MEVDNSAHNPTNDAKGDPPSPSPPPIDNTARGSPVTIAPPGKEFDRSRQWMTHVEIPSRPRPTAALPNKAPPPSRAVDTFTPDIHQRPLLRAIDREKKLSEQVKWADALRAEKEAREKSEKEAKRRAKEKQKQKQKEIQSNKTPAKKVPEKKRTTTTTTRINKNDKVTSLRNRLKKAVTESKDDDEQLAKVAEMLPRGSRLTWKEKPFDILQFVRDVEVTKLSLGQLLAVSPALRRILGDSFKVLPSKEQNVLLAKYPGFGIDNHDPEVCAYLARTDLSKNSTHHFLATVNGHLIKPLMDGGACVNVCSPEFLKRANITNVSNLSKISVRSLGGLLPAVGEASQIPLNIAGQTVIIGCIIMNNVPFELLLGRGFLEMTKCVTHWDSSVYQIQVGGKTIQIDGGNGSAPVVVKDEETQLQIQPRVKKGYRGLLQNENGTDSDGYETESESSATETSASDTSSESEVDPEAADYSDVFLAAIADLQTENPSYATVEELIAEKEAGSIQDVL